jgi:uncharacterized membrane protein HdeD (DUF308 family)
MSFTLIIGWATIIIGLLTYIPYFWSIYKKQTKPHVFSWFIWGLLGAIAFFAQIADGAGPGAWVNGVTAFICFVIAAIALKFGEKNITRSDWITFLGALSAIPVWYVTQNPLYAIILVTVIDALGFSPTFRKSWLKPWEENALTYGLSAGKYALSLLAIENYTMTTVLYSASLVFMNGVFVAMLLFRRKAHPHG